MISQYNKNGWRNPWFLGMVGVVVTAVLVNVVLIGYALHGRSTLVAFQYNSKDRKSDAEAIGNIQSRKALAWKFTIKQPKKIVLGTPASYEIDVNDPLGAPVSGQMQVLAYRASDANKDFPVTFREVSSGKYQGYISFPLKGFWELHMRVTRDKDVFDAESSKILASETGATN